MRLHTTTDPAAITALVEPLLAADPVRNTVFSSVIAGLAGPDADGWCAHPDGKPEVLAVRSQRHTPIVVTSGWADCESLADAVAAQRPVAALGGPVTEVEALTDALGSRGLPATSRIDERLFRLDDLAEPPPPGGTARLATLEDRDLLVQWLGLFELEVFGSVRPGVDAATFIDRALQRLRFWLWADADGWCAMAARHPVAFGVARIGPVYTPPELRGHGYGSAATAKATRDVLAEGAVPVLYTDLANPTSNKIYQQLGYYPVGDRAHVEFS